MLKQTHEEQVIQAKIDVAHYRYRVTTDIRKAQKGTVKGMIKEVSGELQECDTQYI